MTTRISRIAAARTSILMLLLFGAPSFAAEEANKPIDNTLSAILGRIHEHAASKIWRADGWKDEQIETWLEGVVGKIAPAAKLPLKLPVRFADVKPTDEASRQSFDQALLVGKNFRLVSTKLRNCIVLADGNFLADSVQGCIVIARGAISVTSSDSSIIVAGAYARTNADGQSRNLTSGSLFLSPGWVNAETIYGSVIYAGEGIATGRQLDGGVFINATLVVSDTLSPLVQRRPRTVKVRDLPIGDLVNDPLYSQLDVSGIIYPEAMDVGDPLGFVTRLNRNTSRPRPIGLVLRFQNRRYVVNIGKPILDQNEKPVDDLAGWKLSYVNDKLAIFSNGQADAIVRIEDL